MPVFHALLSGGKNCFFLKACRSLHVTDQDTMGVHSTQLEHRCVSSWVVIAFKIWLGEHFILDTLSNTDVKVNCADVSNLSYSWVFFLNIMSCLNYEYLLINTWKLFELIKSTNTSFSFLLQFNYKATEHAVSFQMKIHPQPNRCDYLSNSLPPYKASCS